MKSVNEECDDGNYDSLDGCLLCIKETDSNCNTSVNPT